MLGRILVLLGIALAANAEDPSPWYGRIIGIEDSVGAPPQNLALFGLRNLSYNHAILATDSEIDYVLDPASTTAYVFKRKYDGDGEHGRSLEIIHLDNPLAAKTVPYPPVCNACPNCLGCDTQPVLLAVSKDGHYVFTTMGRLQRTGFLQLIFLIYDTVTEQFLDPIISPPSFGGWILPGSEPDGFETFTNFHGLDRYRIVGSHIQKGEELSEPPLPEGRYRTTSDRANARLLFLYENGKVFEVAPGRLKQLGDIVPLAASRAMFPAALSGNGKLLFVPTGPLKKPANRADVGLYIDQIDVYDAASLAPLRSLHSLRAFLELASNEDGSRLYAVPIDRTSILVLDANSLWQDAERHLTSATIHHITFVPEAPAR